MDRDASAEPGWPARTEPRDRERLRLLLATSSVALALAAIVVVTLHELAHAVAGLSMGSVAVLRPNSVSYVPEPSTTGQVVTAAAGPIFSLVFGAVVFLVGRELAGGFVRLLLLWTGLVSMQNFAGYLLIAPVSRAGDSGTVLGLLDAPVGVYAVCVVLGGALTLLNSRLMAGQVTRYARSQDELRHLALLPWSIGTGITVVLTLLDLWISGLGVDSVPTVVAGGVAIAIFAPMFSFFYRRLHPAYEHLDLRTPLVPLVVTVVLAVLVAAVLGPGLRLG